MRDITTVARFVKNGSAATKFYVTKDGSKEYGLRKLKENFLQPVRHVCQLHGFFCEK